jgi:glycosyltransferase involved in cell wall biosynthesis
VNGTAGPSVVMRVAVVHNLQAGGARRRLSEQLKALPDSTVELCPAGAETITADAIVVPLELAAPRVPRALRPALRYRDLLAVVRAWHDAASRIARLGVDVVFANPCQFLQAPAALLWTRVPTLYFCDEPRRVDYEPAAAQTRNPRTAMLYAPLYRAQRWLDRRAATAATELATNSRYTMQLIERSYGRHAGVVPLGVPDSFGPPQTPASSGHVLSVGTLIPSKGHDLVLQACAMGRVRRRVMLVAPRGDQQEEHRLRRLAARLGVELDIRTHIGDDELRVLYQTAQATLYLAEREPLGLASLEAQACGCPVVVADEGGLPETVVPGRTGFVVPRDAGAAAQALDAFDDEGMRRAMARAAAAHGRAASWRRSGQAIRERLEDLCRAD